MMGAIYWISDGGGDGVGKVHKTCLRWIRAHGSPRLIVIGGDVYDKGTPEEFQLFFDQIKNEDGTVGDLCETAGNHDWKTRSESLQTGEIPSAYEAFWAQFPPPQSRQPIDPDRRGAARHEHIIDTDHGWRLIFLDTGSSSDDSYGKPWPRGDGSRVTWLKNAIGSPGRGKIVFAHHSRVSVGKHGGIENIASLWEQLFDQNGKPLVALTVAGHDHNVTVYNPRGRLNPETQVASFSEGIYVVVNGAGGRAHDLPVIGTQPGQDEFHDSRNYCVTRINLLDGHSADVETLSFGPDKEPPENQDPTLLHTLKIRLPA